MSQPVYDLPPLAPLAVSWKGDVAICFPSQGVQNYYILKKRAEGRGRGGSTNSDQKLKTP